MKHALCVCTRLSYASCIYTFLPDVFKLLTLTIAVNIWKDQVFYMLKPVLFCIADINQTFVNWRTEEKTGLGEGEEASAPVVAGVKDLMVCMKDTGMYLKLTLPNTILRQKIKDIGRMRLQRSAGLTSISGFNCSTLIAMWAPIVEQIKCTVDTVKGNLKSNFCMHPPIHTHFMISKTNIFPAFPPHCSHKSKQVWRQMSHCRSLESFSFGLCTCIVLLHNCHPSLLPHFGIGWLWFLDKISVLHLA